MNMLAMIEWFIPEEIKKQSSLTIRTRFLVSVMILLAGLGLIYNLIYFKVGNAVGGSAILGVVAVICYLPFYLKKSGNLTMTMHLLAGSLVIMNASITFTSGGATFSGTPWWALAPVFSTLVIGGKGARLWMLVVFGTVAGVYIAELFGVTFPNLITQTDDNRLWIHFLDWFHYFGIVLVMTASCLVFDVINRQALDSEKDTRTKVEEASRKIEEYNQYLGESVERILGEMQKLAEGDLTTRLDTIKEDDIGRLCEGFNQAVNRVQEAIAEVNQAVDVTADSTNSISGVTQKLAEGAKAQSEQASEIASATSEIVAIISENAGNARDTATAAKTNGDLASEGGYIVSKTVQKMEEIADVVNESAKSISSLGDSTSQIGNIVSVIQEIAEKTNLLALNAAIEASHAGVMGKGFGVIAEEVKDLAKRTTNETERIGVMIETVQKESERVITHMRQGNNRVEEGKDLASRAGAALNQIVESSTHVSNLIEQIAYACEEQTRQSEYLFNRIEDLNNVTESSAVEIEEIAKSAGGLGNLTVKLQDLLHRFILETQSGQATSSH